MGIRFSGGRCCCQNCRLFSDDFNRADSSDIGASWSEASGAWEIAANKLKATSAGLAVWDTAVSESSYRVHADVVASGDDDIAGVVACFSDTSNYYSAEVTFHATDPVEAKLELVRTSGGTRTVLGTAALPVTAATSGALVGICVTAAGIVSAWVGPRDATLPAQMIDATDTTLTRPGKAGVYARSISPNATFDDFHVQKNAASDPSCPTCPSQCRPCRHNPVREIEVVIAGVFTSFFGCNNCETWNGTYTIEKRDGCNWEYDIDPDLDLGTGGSPASQCDGDKVNGVIPGFTEGSPSFQMGIGLLNGNGDTISFTKSINTLMAEDQFNRADGAPGADWSSLAGTWAIASNRLVSDDDGALIRWAGAFTPPAGYKVSAQIVLLGSVNQIGGLVGYASASDTYYLALIDRSGTVSLHKVVGGTRTLLASASFTVGDADFWAMDIIHVDGVAAVELHAGISGNVVLAVNDTSPLTPGRPGLWVEESDGSNVQFDTFRVHRYACDFDGEELPFTSGGGGCGVTGSTATITAL